MTRSPFSQSCCTTPSAMFFWGAASVLLYIVGLLLRSVWPAVGPYGDRLILVALGPSLATTIVCTCSSTPSSVNRGRSCGTVQYEWRVAFARIASARNDARPSRCLSMVCLNRSSASYIDASPRCIRWLQG